MCHALIEPKKQVLTFVSVEEFCVKIHLKIRGGFVKMII